MGRNHESNKFTFIKHVPRFAFIKRGLEIFSFFIDSNLRVEYEYE
jgi:hypothetical protein